MAHISFWAAFSQAWASAAYENAKLELFEIIAYHATPASLTVLFQNDTGGNYLAAVFGAGARRAYFEASLHDVLFGTNRVGSLPLEAIEGATTWTDGFGWDPRFTGSLSWSVLNRLGDVGWRLHKRTLEVAMVYAARGGDVNGREWSLEQRIVLRPLGVDVGKEETSAYQILADEMLSCGASTSCLTSILWLNEWEVDFW